ncbi:MAG: GspH/FimT family pseudopilin [Acidobacteria bacterium]|jgi:prepilin-type N-terminal cleavage/methylation domain-containing protein|nr:GspH/FimT family pseudopilin [Acidobacteriota bacterium]
MGSRGFSLTEMLVVTAVIVVMAAVGFPNFRAFTAEAHLLGAARTFKGEFRRARSMAVRSGVYTAIRFERRLEGEMYAVYADGNSNGIRSSDILAGRDRLVAGPFPLTGGAPGVRVGIIPGTPTPPPGRGELTGDPIRFGRSDILSFSPLGTATPGTFYLAGDGVQAAVRVTGGSARVRLMTCRGGVWRAR